MPNPLWDLQFIVLGLLPHLNSRFPWAHMDRRGPDWRRRSVQSIKRNDRVYYSYTKGCDITGIQESIDFLCCSFSHYNKHKFPKKLPGQDKLEAEEALNSTIIPLYQQLCLLPLMSFLQPEELPEKNLCQCDRCLFEVGCVFSPSCDRHIHEPGYCLCREVFSKVGVSVKMSPGFFVPHWRS